MHSSLPFIIHFKWSFISKSSSLKKFCAQCCLQNLIPNSAWDKVEPLHLQQKKKFWKLTYYSHIHYGYHAYIQWYVLKKEINIFSDSKYSRFHYALLFIFFFCCGEEVEFFLLFQVCFVFFLLCIWNQWTKNNCYTTYVFIHEQRALKQTYVEQEKLSSLFWWNYLCPTGIWWVFAT